MSTTIGDIIKATETAKSTSDASTTTALAADDKAKSDFTAYTQQQTVQATAIAKTGPITVANTDGTFSTYDTSTTAPGYSVEISHGADMVVPDDSGGGTNPPVSPPVTPPVATESYTLEGPSTGVVNVQSAEFTIGGVPADFTGTVTVESSVPGFPPAPQVFTYPLATPAQFTITPTSVETVTISVVSSGTTAGGEKVTDPAPLTYTVTAQ